MRGKAIVSSIGAICAAAVTLLTPVGHDLVSWYHDWRNGQDQLKIVVQSLNTAMNDAALGRKQLHDLTGRVDGCTISPTAAVSTIQAIEAANRKNVLKDDLAGVTAPSNQDAADLLREFKLTLKTSFDADRQYEDWLRDWRTNYPAADPQNCSHPPHTPAWIAFVSLSNTATNQKTAFASHYNPVAKRYGLRHNWRTWDF